LPLQRCATDLTEGRILRSGQVLKITRAVNGEVVIKLSGRMNVENIAELETLVRKEVDGRRIVLDLKDLTLVDQDAVGFLKRCEADSIKLKNCPAYIREWITRERHGS
jgi:anti-anti-sigma regulatory factor